MGAPRLDAADPGDGDVVHKGLDHWGDLDRSGKGCGWAGKQLDKKRGLCVQGGGREKGREWEEMRLYLCKGL